MDIYIMLLKVALVLAVGFVGALIARKLKLPNVSGYLVLGLLLGPSLGLIFKDFKGVITVEDNTALEFISELALAFIAFSIGSEFALKNIKKLGKEIFTLTTFEVVGAVLVVFLALFFFAKPESFKRLSSLRKRKHSIWYDPFPCPWQPRQRPLLWSFANIALMGQ